MRVVERSLNLLRMFEGVLQLMRVHLKLLLDMFVFVCFVKSLKSFNMFKAFESQCTSLKAFENHGSSSEFLEVLECLYLLA